MSNSQKFVQCPKCHSLVRFDRLERHIGKVHTQQNLSENAEKIVGKLSKFPESSGSKEFKRLKSFVESWVRRKKEYLYNSDNVHILTIMVFEKFNGYSFDEIYNLYCDKIKKDLYVLKSTHFHVTYKEMIIYLQKMRYLPRTPRVKSAVATPNNGSNIRNSNTQNFYENSQSPGNSNQSDMDWYDCNTVDKIDGSKYIGYQRREYENSRFGSFPLHDDYSDESWADNDPWG